MPFRKESPSSINTYFQCPRKYYYIYKLKMKTSPSIHLVRGVIAHSVLEHFFDIDHTAFEKDYQSSFQIIMLGLLDKYWSENKTKLNSLNLTDLELKFYYTDTKNMLLNWLNQFNKKLTDRIQSGESYFEAFENLKPLREILYDDDDLYVKGYIDAIENIDGKIRLMDYKTSKKDKLTDDYRRQLSIYALLYQKKHGVLPSEVGIYFLKFGENTLTVDSDLISDAKFVIEQIHASTVSNDIDDYTKKVSPLCKWSKGQCDFYDYCFNNKPIPKKPLR